MSSRRAAAIGKNLALSAASLIGFLIADHRVERTICERHEEGNLSRVDRSRTAELRDDRVVA
jgi:hypothetical protein